MATEKKRLEGPDKAALLLLSLGPELSTPVMQYMDDSGLTEIARRMPKLGDFPPEEVDKVFAEFEELMAGGGVLFGANPEDVEKLLEGVVDGPRLQRILDSLNDDAPIRMRVWEKLARMRPQAIVNLIQNEKAQTIAIILGHINPELSSEVIEMLPQTLQSAVVVRMSKLESMPKALVNDIEEALDAQMSDSQGGGGGLNFDGMVRVVDILKTLKSDVSKNIMDDLKETEPELFEQVDAQLLVFEDFIELADRDIQTILKQVSSEDLVRSLKGASDDLGDLFFRNMSQRAADIMREDMQVMGPLKVSDVEMAQRAILEVARKLDEEGAISMGQQEEMVG